MAASASSASSSRRNASLASSSWRGRWIVGLLAYAVGMATFQILHVFVTPEGLSSQSYSFSLLDCPTGRTSTEYAWSIRPSAIGDANANADANTTSNHQHHNHSHHRNPHDHHDHHHNNSEFAYAFLISGCDPSSPLTYRPYLWNVLVATKNLVESGSHADVVVMIQFSNAATTTNTSTTATATTAMELPIGDVQWLLDLYPNTIQLRYLPPLVRDNFYNAQLAKFHILELIHYERVLYLDADVMPLCNLDYMFQLSSMTATTNKGSTDEGGDDSGWLQPNVVLAWFTEPSHGGFFLLQPGQYDDWQAIVERREAEALTLDYPHWDPILGWGKILTEEWSGLPQPLTNPKTGIRTYLPPRHSTNWTFHGDFADQGLLYYWTRFHRQSVSVVYLDYVLDYGTDGTLLHNRSAVSAFGGGPNTTLPSTTYGGETSSSRRRSCSCLPPGMEHEGQYGSTLQAPLFLEKIPHRDFCHFSGNGKPWESSRQAFPTTRAEVHSSTDYWYYQLGKIFQAFAQHHPGRQLPRLPLKYKAPTLGRYPTYRSMIGTIHKKQRKKEKKSQEERQQAHQ